MQRLRIRHVTEYGFSETVTLKTHRLLLRPREGHDVRIESSRLEIAPAYNIKWLRDVFDNSVALVSFLQPADSLRIVSEVVIQHYADTAVSPENSQYLTNAALNYQSSELADLVAYQQPTFPDDQAAVRNWLQQIGLYHAQHQPSHSLSVLNQAINKRFEYGVREEAGVQSPSQTLALASGSCRDYATLFIEACRALGLASRFVSGYLHTSDTEAGNASTHAWAEVYLSGIGWQGFDPTGGEMSGNRHIAVAVARNPQAVPPVSGSFLGTRQIEARMRVDVQVNLLN